MSSDFRIHVPRFTGDVRVPFDVIVTGDAPVAGSHQIQAIVNGSQIGRFKIENMGNAKATIIWLEESDWGLHAKFGALYNLLYSDQNSNNFTANIAVSKAPSIQFAALNNQQRFSIDGNAYRFITTQIADIGPITYGDTFQLGIVGLGSIAYIANEADLGYDANLDGKIAGNTILLPVGTIGSFPVQLGTVEKQ